MTLIKEDAIQKKLTMNANNKRYYSEEYIKGWEDGVRDQYNATMPTNDNWIPVSERLPQCGVGMHYLVTLKDGHCFKDDVYEAFFDKNGWHMGYNELADDDVIAWMPLPTPYKGE